MTPTLSIVIPTRDCLAYLPAALASVRAEPIDSEILVIDDGSVDGTGAWLAEQAAADPRVRVIEGGGRGVSAARNAGIASARAPLVAFLDADDVWSPGAIRRRLALMQREPAAVLAFADYESHLPDGTSIGRCLPAYPRFRRWLAGRAGMVPLGGRAVDLLLAENVCGTSTVIARRAALERLGGFDCRFSVCEDLDLWLRLARLGPVWCDTELAAHYLVRPDSAVRNVPKVIATLAEIGERYGGDARDPAALRILASRIARGRGEIGRAEGNPRDALAGHWGSFRLYPSWAAFKRVVVDLRNLARTRAVR